MYREKIKVVILFFVFFTSFLFVSCESNEVQPIINISDDVPTNVMASFAKATYEDNLYRDYEIAVQVPCSNSEWKLAYSRQLGEWDPTETDFWYQIYESNNSVVIAFRGTPPIDVLNPAVYGNWKETISLILGNDHPQDAYVRDEVKSGTIKSYLDMAKTDNKKVFVTGHSLGGHLAMIAYLEIQNQGYENIVGKVETFNAVGLQESDANAITKNGVGKIRQHYTCCDIANWGSETTILGQGKLYFPAAERPMKAIVTNPDGTQHTHSTERGKASWWDWITLSISYWAYEKLEEFNIGIAAHDIDNFDLCEVSIDPNTVNPETGLSEDILPGDILEEIKELGLEIHSGTNPPLIVGSYFITPLLLVNSNFSDGYPSGFKFADEYLTYSNQDDEKLTVQVDYQQGGSTATGLGAFISGSSNKFTVYVPVVSTDEHGHIRDLIEVHSGEIQDGGIAGWQMVLIMKDDHGDPDDNLIENGQGRLIEDGDGFSERTSKKKSVLLLRNNKNGDGVSIFHSKK